MLDDLRMRESRSRAAQRRRYAGMAGREGLYGYLVNEARGSRRQGSCERQWHFDHGLGDEGRGIDRSPAWRRQIGVPYKRSVEPPGLGIDQKLCRIEQMAPRRIKWAFGTQAVASAGLHAGDEAMMDIVPGPPRQDEAGDFSVTARLEQADEDLLGMPRQDRKVDAVLMDRHTKPCGLAR